jgi:hypothetical protein
MERKTVLQHRLTPAARLAAKSRITDVTSHADDFRRRGKADIASALAVTRCQPDLASSMTLALADANESDRYPATSGVLSLSFIGSVFYASLISDVDYMPNGLQHSSVSTQVRCWGAKRTSPLRCDAEQRSASARCAPSLKRSTARTHQRAPGGRHDHRTAGTFIGPGDHGIDGHR